MRDIYQEITDKIIQALQNGTRPWLKPWKESKCGSFDMPHNAVTGRQYNGINLLVLSCASFGSNGWLTFKQAKELGGTVRKGEHGTQIVFWKIEVKPDRADPSKMRKFFLARAYTVFNLDQCENLDPKRVKVPEPPVKGDTDITALALRHGVKLQHGGNRAFFAPSFDLIQMPSADAFTSTAHYDATLAHELTHWTGHETRLNRDYHGRFGSEAYAFEELVAEMGSAFVCAHMGIDATQLQHADYVANWLKVLRDDKRAVFTAASKAKQACEYLIKCEAEESESDESEESSEVQSLAA